MSISIQFRNSLGKNMASLPHQIPSLTLGACTSTNKNSTFTPCINAQLLHNKRQVVKPILSPIAIVGRKKPMRDLREQCQNEQWKAPRCIDERGSTHDEFSPQHSLVLHFYKAFNDKDTQTLDQLLSPHHCAYHDLLFYGPYEGKESVLHFLHSAMDALGPNVHIRLEDVLENPNFATTVFWHLEWKTKKIPFSSGCRIFEFEEVEGRLHISRITGLEELPVKPGELVLKLLKTIRTLLDNYPLAAQAILESHSSGDSPHGGIDTHLDLFRRRQ